MLHHTIKLSLLFRPGNFICISVIHTQTHSLCGTLIIKTNFLNQYYNFTTCSLFSHHLSNFMFCFLGDLIQSESSTELLISAFIFLNSKNAFLFQCSF